MKSSLTTVVAPMAGIIAGIEVRPGDDVRSGRSLLLIEAMKMQHDVASQVNGIVDELAVAVGETVAEGDLLMRIRETACGTGPSPSTREARATEVRSDLQDVRDRKAAGQDENRPEAVARRHCSGHRTARENIADLCDAGSFQEYGSLVLAAQRSRRTIEDLIENTTGDGLICGFGHVNGDQFPDDRSRAVVLAYDGMVLAGTQGMKNHEKKDRLLGLARRYGLPVVLFAEGGGGRPGDTDYPGVSGLDCLAFSYFARLSALVPLIGITSGRCFAGNAVLLGCCDVIIATEGSNIGVGGPAMVEGGGLGVFRPEDIGPMDVQVSNGVIDIPVQDEAEAVAVAKKYLSYFQGSVMEWQAPDSEMLRGLVSEDRRLAYDMREVIRHLADVDSVLELRRQWAVGMITALIRIEGRPLGLVANHSEHLGGAIDANGADKAARFLQLCDAFGLPVLSLCDCPGLMVGPDSESTAMVRYAGRLFVTGANLRAPLMTIVTRRGYGLGAMAMAGGSFKSPLFTVAWPTGEFGAMGLEGAVRLGFRRELAAVEDPDERESLFQDMVADMRTRGQALNIASHFEIDDVIDPADSRRWVVNALRSLPPPGQDRKKRPQVEPS